MVTLQEKLQEELKRCRKGLELYDAMQNMSEEDLLELASKIDMLVMYTIHNHDLAGGRGIKENSIDHWITANVLSLKSGYQMRLGYSYVGGKKVEVPIFYWNMDKWKSLANFWKIYGGGEW